MADLAVGDKVEVVKEQDGPFMVSVIGKVGTVLRKVSGGYMISVPLSGSQTFEFIVGSIDWAEQVKRHVHQSPTPSSVPPSLAKWYRETAKVVKNG